jgi:hypothetical protein
MIAYIFFYIISGGATIISGFYIYTIIKNNKNINKKNKFIS